MPRNYVVERIVGKRLRDQKFVEYKVKWKKFPSSQNTWQPLEHLENVQDLIQEFEQRNSRNIQQYFGSNAAPEKKSDQPTRTLHKPHPSNQTAMNVRRGRIEPTEDHLKRTLKKKGNNHRRKGMVFDSDAQQKEEQEEQPRNIFTEKGPQKDLSEQDLTKEQRDNFEGNLDRIVDQLVKTVELNKKLNNCEVLGVKMNDFDHSLAYLVKETDGNTGEYSREELQNNHSRELINFYENQWICNQKKNHAESAEETAQFINNK